MSIVKIILRTADQTRKAEIESDRGTTGADLIQSAVDQWSLPTDTDYTLVNTSTNRAILPNDSLNENIVKDGDILEVQPVLVAGVN